MCGIVTPGTPRLNGGSGRRLVLLDGTEEPEPDQELGAFFDLVPREFDELGGLLARYANAEYGTEATKFIENFNLDLKELDIPFKIEKTPYVLKPDSLAVQEDKVSIQYHLEVGN